MMVTSIAAKVKEGGSAACSGTTTIFIIPPQCTPPWEYTLITEPLMTFARIMKTNMFRLNIFASSYRMGRKKETTPNDFMRIPERPVFDDTVRGASDSDIGSMLLRRMYRL